MKRITLLGLMCLLSVMLAVPQASAAASGTRIAATAKTYLGDFKYKFGAEPWNSRYKYSDCSSFVQLVFNKRHGYHLPRTSRSQAKKGKYVSKSNLKKGDLVFFDTNDDGKINHVGIYIGNGDFIHSSPVNRVGKSDLSSGWWKKHYVTARRVL
ncbi:NlpC/P60 family protein [Paenibacillus antri]|uniref:NlpC/P60 family protein n=1 Tax=Paenibacillus antri TaxID=2582848 RepID=A0A5R9G477_9BACL|nr:C40 family peptidase [Paenibacillus antri]TLS51167.1 NlpC/P60 family protein [Paenibacillus antri]